MGAPQIISIGEISADLPSIAFVSNQNLLEYSVILMSADAALGEIIQITPRNLERRMQLWAQGIARLRHWVSLGHTLVILLDIKSDDRKYMFASSSLLPGLKLINAAGRNTQYCGPSEGRDVLAR